VDYVLVVVVAEAARQLLVVHLGLVLADAPASGHLVRVGQLELPTVAGPGDERLAGFVRQELQQELPQLDGARACGHQRHHRTTQFGNGVTCEAGTSGRPAVGVSGDHPVLEHGLGVGSQGIYGVSSLHPRRKEGGVRVRMRVRYGTEIVVVGPLVRGPVGAAGDRLEGATVVGGTVRVAVTIVIPPRACTQKKISNSLLHERWTASGQPACRPRPRNFFRSSRLLLSSVVIYIAPCASTAYRHYVGTVHCSQMGSPFTEGRYANLEFK
jgi:hypothetical protein